METKICANKECKEELPATTKFFYRNKHGKLGLCSQCKKCFKKYSQSDSGKIVKKKYKQSEKGKSSNKRYKQSEKGKIVSRRSSGSEKGKLRKKKYRDSEKGKENYKQYYENNGDKYQYKPEKYKEYVNSDKYRELRRKKYLSNKLSFIMSDKIRKSLKGNKAGWHWETLVLYNLEELQLHLQDTIGLTTKHVLHEFWQNVYGKYYHVDHMRPKTSFDSKKLQDPDSEEFKECWSLENLQLLSPEENLRKGVHYDCS